MIDNAQIERAIQHLTRYAADNDFISVGDMRAVLLVMKSTIKNPCKDCGEEMGANWLPSWCSKCRSKECEPVKDIEDIYTLEDGEDIEPVKEFSGYATENPNVEWAYDETGIPCKVSKSVSKDERLQPLDFDEVTRVLHEVKHYKNDCTIGDYAKAVCQKFGVAKQRSLSREELADIIYIGRERNDSSVDIAQAIHAAQNKGAE